GILELIPAGGERDVRGLDDEGDQERVAQPLGCLARTGEVDGVHEQGHEAAHVHVEETGETAPGHGVRHDWRFHLMPGAEWRRSPPGEQRWWALRPGYVDAGGRLRASCELCSPRRDTRRAATSTSP